LRQRLEVYRSKKDKVAEEVSQLPTQWSSSDVGGALRPIQCKSSTGMFNDESLYASVYTFRLPEDCNLAFFAQVYRNTFVRTGNTLQKLPPSIAFTQPPLRGMQPRLSISRCLSPSEEEQNPQHQEKSCYPQSLESSGLSIS
jgi:hypothetical protein